MSKKEHAEQCDAKQLAQVTHDFRSPLNGIIGFAELLHDEKLGSVSSQQKECLHDILTSARYLLLLVNDIQDLSKVTSGKLHFHPEKLSLALVLQETQKLFAPMIRSKNIDLSTELDPALQEVMIDPMRFKQVLFNFVSNALKFTLEQGRVQIRLLREPKNGFRLEVIDNGIGIRKEDLHRLFVPFEQIDVAETRQYPGTGLGLVLSKHIVELMGGQVGVESTIGKGSLFYAVFPMTIG